MTIASKIPIVRIVAFGVVSLFSLIVLSLCAYCLSVEGPVPFAEIGIASSVITLFSLSTMVILDKKRTGIFTSFVVFEVLWLGFLWIMWVVTVANTSPLLSFISCFTPGDDCHVIPAIAAFGHLNWIIIFIYILVLLIMSIIAGCRGNKVWTKSVSDANFGARPVKDIEIDAPIAMVSPEKTQEQTPVPLPVQQAPPAPTPSAYTQV